MLPSLEAKLIAGALALALLLAGFLGFVHHERAIGAAKVEAAAREAGAAASAANHAESTRREAAQKDISDESQRLSTRAVDDAADAHAAGERLFDRAGGGAPAGHPAAAQGGPAAGAGSGVPADLLRGAVEAAERYAAIADRRGIAGAACELDYGALRP